MTFRVNARKSHSERRETLTPCLDWFSSASSRVRCSFFSFLFSSSPRASSVRPSSFGSSALPSSPAPSSLPSLRADHFTLHSFAPLHSVRSFFSSPYVYAFGRSSLSPSLFLVPSLFSFLSRLAHGYLPRVFILARSKRRGGNGEPEVGRRVGDGKERSE